MNWITAWLNVRAVRRFERIHDRELRATVELERKGRHAEMAEAMEEIAQAYARETRVIDYLDAVIGARIRRCEALIRSGQEVRAAAEAVQLTESLLDNEGPDSENLRVLRERLAAAERGEEPSDEW